MRVMEVDYRRSWRAAASGLVMGWFASVSSLTMVSPAFADGEVEASIRKVIMYANDGTVLSVESDGTALLHVSLVVRGKTIDAPEKWLRKDFTPSISRTRLFDCTDLRLPQYTSCYAVEVEGRFSGSAESASDLLYFEFQNGSFVGTEEVRDAVQADAQPVQVFHRNGTNLEDGMNAALDLRNRFLLVAATSFDLKDCDSRDALICLDSGYFTLYVPQALPKHWSYGGYDFERREISADQVRRFPAARYAVESIQRNGAYVFLLDKGQLVGWEVAVENPDGNRERYFYAMPSTGRVEPATAAAATPDEESAARLANSASTYGGAAGRRSDQMQPLLTQLAGAPDASSRMELLSAISGRLSELTADEIDGLDPSVSALIGSLVSPEDAGVLVWAAAVLSQLGPSALAQVEKLEAAVAAYKDPPPPPDGVDITSLDVRADVRASIGRIRDAFDRNARGLPWKETD